MITFTFKSFILTLAAGVPISLFVLLITQDAKLVIDTFIRTTLGLAFISAWLIILGKLLSWLMKLSAMRS
jgi:hypothetical protein